MAGVSSERANRTPVLAHKMELAQRIIAEKERHHPMEAGLASSES